MKRPPFHDNPAPPVSERPKCAYCRRPLTPQIFGHRDLGTHKTIHRFWTGRYDAYGEFDTLRCALKFARSAYRNGYRIKGTT